MNTKRRLELKGEVNQVRVFDDFAHHPTAIAKTLAGMRANVGNKRVIAILEPRSNTMKSGVHKDTLANSLADADIVFVYQGEQVKWSVDALIADCKQPCIVGDNVDQMVVDIIKQTKTGDTLLVMSNGGFGGIHDKLLSALAKL